MRSRFMEWKGSSPPFFFFSRVWGLRDIYFQQILFFSIPTIFLYIQRFSSFFCSQIMWDTKRCTCSRPKWRKEGRSPHSYIVYDVLRAILLRKANAVTWCKSLELSNFLFWKCCYVKSRCESIAHTFHTAKVDQQPNNTPSIHPSNIWLDGWMDGCCVDRKQFIQWKKKKKVFPLPWLTRVVTYMKHFVQWKRECFIVP